MITVLKFKKHNWGKRPLQELYNLKSHFKIWSKLQVLVGHLHPFLLSAMEHKHYLSRLMDKPTMWFPTRSDTNRSVQSQKQARSFKFRMKEEERLYYPCSENKGADQLRSYCEADLRLCFRLRKLLVFPYGAHLSNDINNAISIYHVKSKTPK